MIEPKIRAVVFKERDWWIIHLLEYDLSTAVRRCEDIAAELRRFVLVQIAASHECGQEPFQGFAPAPARYWELFERAQTTLEVPLGLPPELDLDPEPRIDTRIAA
jgi:hypothetical protein